MMAHILENYMQIVTLKTKNKKGKQHEDYMQIPHSQDLKQSFACE